MDDIHLHHHVLVHEVSQRTLVGYDAAHLCRGKEDILGLLGRKERLHLALAGKVEFTVCAGYDGGVALAFQFADYRGADHPAMAGHIYPRILLHLSLI